MSTSETIDVNDLPAFGERIARDVLQGDYTPALKSIAVAAKADFKENFAGSHAPDGTPWAPIKGFRQPRGAKSQDNMPKDHQPLRDKGLLAASASSQGNGHVENIASMSMEVGTNLFYAGTHQKGVPSDVWSGYPKNAKALAIPISREAYRAGGPRKMTVELELVWPKGYSHGWLVQAKEGKGLGNKGGGTILHFLLVPKVTIPARPFVGWSKGLLATTDDILARRMQKLAGGG